LTDVQDAAMPPAAPIIPGAAGSVLAVDIGGGVARAWDVLEPPLTASMREYAGMAFVRRVEIVRSALDGRAGLLGVAALVHHPETA
jgi:predicted NBD/HSP70 family sugar kinase